MNYKIIIIILIIGITTSLLVITTPITRLVCEARGGEWGKLGISPVEECNPPTSDGGKICTDKSQCEGLCLAEDINSTTGKCADWKRAFGCVNVFENDRVIGGLCLD